MISRRGCPAWLVVLMALAGAGCETQEEGSPDLELCDVATRPCQEAIYYSMLNLRNDGYDPFAGLPPIRVISEAQFREELVADAKKNQGREPSPWDEALRLLHLYPPAPDGGVGEDGGVDLAGIEEEATHVYAYYDTRAKDVTVIAHPQLEGEDALKTAMISLAHEFVHALQDREMDLEASNAVETSDEYLAASVLIEGDARFYDTLYAAKLERALETPKVVAAVDWELNYYFTHFDELGSPFFAAQLLMYPLGAKYLANRWAAGGNPAVRRAYGQAPSTTAGFLLNPDGSRPTGTARPMACEAPSANGATLQGIDRFGALLLYNFLRGWQVDHPTAYALAQGWTDDQIVVYRRPESPGLGVAWRVELGQPFPEAVLAALTRTGELTLTPEGTALTIVAASPGTRIDWQAGPGCP